MEIQFIDNQNLELANILRSEIGISKQTKIAVAFVSYSGLLKLESAIKTTLATGGEVEMLVGLDFATTEPRALWTMHEWAKNKAFKYFCSPISGPIYHPKMYLMRGLETEAIVVGSSNLTGAGLSKNAEANIYIRDGINSQVFSDAHESYVRLKFDGRRTLNPEFLALYERKSKEHSSQTKGQTSELTRLFSTIEPEFAGLPRPKPTSGDLTGWLKLIYEAIPQGEFTNNEIYQYEDYFRTAYPKNQNIQAKIRQQLQVLRDIGMIENVSRGVWRKTGITQRNQNKE